MRTEIRKALEPFRRRLTAEGLLQAAMESCMVTCGAAAVLFALWQFDLITPALFFCLIPLFCLGLGGFFILHRPTWGRTARRVDRTYELQDRTATMVHLAQDEAFFSSLQRQDTIEKLKQLDPKVLRLRFTRRRWLALALCVILSAAVAAGAFASARWLRGGEKEYIETDEMKLARALLQDMRERLNDADLSEQEREELLRQIEETENALEGDNFGLDELAGITRTVGELQSRLDESLIRRGWIYLLREEPHFTAVAEGMINEDIPAMQAALVANYNEVMSKTGTQEIIALMDLKTEIDEALEADNEPDDADAYLQYTFYLFADDMLGAANHIAAHKNPDSVIFNAFSLLEKRLISIINGVDIIVEADENEENIYFRQEDGGEGSEDGGGMNGRAAEEGDAEDGSVLLYTADPDGMQGAGTGTRSQQHYEESEKVYEPSLDPYSTAYDAAREFEFELNGIEIENSHVAYGQVYGSYYARMIEAIMDGRIP